MIGRGWTGLLRHSRRLVRREGLLWLASIVVVLVVGSVLSWVFWDCLHDDRESVSSTVRNVGLVIGGVVAALLAVWRSRVAERQASAAHRQVEAAQQGLLNERYQRGAEMLGSNVLAVRVGGIYALQRLANEHPKEYHIQIMRLLCAFVRNPTVEGYSEIGLTDHKTGETTESDDDGHGRPRQDVEAAMEAIATRSKIGIDLERDDDFRLDLRNADIGALRLLRLRNVDLSGAQLTDANLSGIWLSQGTDLSSIKEGYGVNLSKARLNGVNFRSSNLWEANLSDSLLVRAELQIADLRYTDLSRATLANADLSGSFLRNSILSGTKFSIAEHPPARGLTQEELDKARADPENPPRLDGVLDAFTGEQLVWRDRPLADEA